MAYNEIDIVSARTTNRQRNIELMIEQELFGLRQQLTAYGVFSMQSLFQQALAASSADMFATMKVFVQVTGAAITRNREGRIKQIHREAAQDALIYIQKSYQTNRIKGKPYRTNETDKFGRSMRDAGGKLERALTSPRMYRVARDGLDFIDPIWLDSQARQWYRLNFGAGPRGANTKAAPTARMVIFGQTLPGDFGLTGFKPSEKYFLPPGFWMDSKNTVRPWDAGRRGQDRFFLFQKSASDDPKQIRATEKRGLLRTKPTPSMGFKGTRYLDSGVIRLTKTLPIQYTKMFSEWFDEFNKTGGGPFAGETIRSTSAAIKKAERTVRAEMATKQSRIRNLQAFRYVVK